MFTPIGDVAAHVQDGTLGTELMEGRVPQGHDDPRLEAGDGGGEVGFPAVGQGLGDRREGDVIVGWAAPEGIRNRELAAFEPGTGNAVVQHTTGWSHEGPTGLRFFGA